MRLQDEFGRHFPYLRLSVTEACNFRCGYCLPDGYRRTAPHQFLTAGEIKGLVTVFAGLGVKKVRLTGGEPTLRRDLAEIIRTIRDVPGIETVALTTNAYRLVRDLPDYAAAGLTALNVSVDSLNPGRFQAITGHDLLERVLEAVALAGHLGIPKVKLNTVLLKGVNDGEIGDFAEFVRTRPLSARFIELMRTGDNADYFAARHADPAGLIAGLEADGWVERLRGETDGPARSFHHPAHLGTLGFISPYSRDFCKNCNRLRVSARGGLQLCLFGDGVFDLRLYLSGPDRIHELEEKIVRLLGLKPEQHGLAAGRTGRTRQLAMIGG